MEIGGILGIVNFQYRKVAHLKITFIMFNYGIKRSQLMLEEIIPKFY